MSSHEVWIAFCCEPTNGSSNNLSLLLNKSTLGNVDTIQELSDILVAGLANLLDVSGSLGNGLQRVTLKDKLILLGLGDLDLDSLTDGNLSNVLLTEVVSDLNSVSVVDDVNVDGEMGIDISHLVSVTLGNTGNQVLDKRLDGTESSNVLSLTVVDRDLDKAVRDLAESNVNVLELLGQSTTRSSDSDNSGLDSDSDALRDGDLLVSLDVLHY